MFSRYLIRPLSICSILKVAQAFCLARSTKDSCAVHVRKRPQRMTVYISNSNHQAEDKAYATEILQLIESGIATDSNSLTAKGFSRFQVAYLGIVTKYCSKKIKSLCEELKRYGLHELSREIASPHAFSPEVIEQAMQEERECGEARTGDQMLVEFSGMLANGGGIAEGVRVAVEVIKQFINKASKGGEELLERAEGQINSTGGCPEVRKK